MKQHKSLHVKKAEEMQNKIYREMSPKQKLEVTSQLIILAKKLRESKTIKNDRRPTFNKNS